MTGLLDRLGELREAASSVATFPWDRIGEVGIGHARCDVECIGSVSSPPEADLIVAAVNALPTLLRIARAAEALEASLALPRARETFPELWDLHAALASLGDTPT